MLTITRTIGARGPIFDLNIGVSYQLELAMKAKGRAVPDPIPVCALLDTGADCTLVDSSIPVALAISAKDRQRIHCLDSPGDRREERGVYDADIVFVDGGQESTRYTMRVVEHSFGQLPYKAIIGRDLLKCCTFNYVGHENEIILNI